MNARIVVFSILVAGCAQSRTDGGHAATPSSNDESSCSAPEPDVVRCEFERRLAQDPALALPRPESVTVHFSPDSAARLEGLSFPAESLAVERARTGRAELRHTLVALPSGDGIMFQSRVTNVGHLLTAVTSLCYPTVSSAAWRQPHPLVAVGCYGSDVALAPGESLVVRNFGRLRGTPGRYRFEVHPVDPAALDAGIDLELVAWRRP